MDIEALSVGEIERMIAMCPRLRAYIDKNDKTPFTDGHIEVYRDAPPSNASRLGRVPVQVKGHSVAKLATRPQKRPILRTDLLAFAQDSGVLYFVVHVEKETGKCAAFYVNLAPFKIAALLEESNPRTKSISVSLKEFPSEVSELERIVNLALRTRDQNPEAGFDPVLLEGAEGFTLYSASKPNFDGPVRIDLASGDVSLVLHTAGGMAVPLPGVFEILPGDYTRQRVGFQVASGTTTYDQLSRQRLDEETLELTLGDGVTLTLREPAGARLMTASYRSQGSLASRLRAFEFMRSLSATSTIQVDGKVAHLGVVTSNEPVASMADAQARLRRLADLFESLGVDPELVDPDSIGSSESSRLTVLHTAFVEGEEVSGDLPKGGLMLERVGPWRLMIIVEAGSAPGKWRLVDPFSPQFRQQFWAQPEAEGSSPHPVTPYDIVEQVHLPLVLNLRLGSIVGAYEAISDWPDSTFGRANLCVLALIGAGDACGDRRDEFLDAANDLNEWLLDVQGDEPQHLVNRWQILRRRGDLTPGQRREIRELRDRIAGDTGNPLGHFVVVACALLLGGHEEVDYLVSQLSPEDLSTLQKWPIWALYE